MEEAETTGPEVCEPYCPICRPSRRPWDWDGPYQTFRWSAHLIGYPAVINVLCDEPGCQRIAECDGGKLGDIPAMRLRRAQEALREAGWFCDRQVNLCPEHAKAGPRGSGPGFED